MIQVYVRTYIGEFDTQEEADAYLKMEHYNFDEDVQPVYEDDGQKRCEDCDDKYEQSEGRYYKYEPSIWLCDSCHDDRMEDE